MTIYLIRHCEAEGNITRRAHGHFDGKPTPNGLRQCQALAKRFDGIHLDAVYASHLTRANVTASYLAAPRGLNVIIDPRFAEIGLGVWEDRSWGEVARDYPQEWDLFSKEPWNFSIESGESYRQVADRFMAGLREMAATYNHSEVIALVSHSLALRCAVGRILDVPFEQPDGLSHCDNTGVTTINVSEDGALNIEKYACNTHLGELSTQAKLKRPLLDSHEINRAWAALRFDRAVDDMDTAIKLWHEVDCAVHRVGGLCPIETIHEELTTKPSYIARTAENEPIGIVVINLDKSAAENGAHISVLGVTEAQRGRSVGVQLIGQAMSVARKHGRSKLTLSVTQSNEHALALYRKMGFIVAYEFEQHGYQKYRMELML